MKMTDNSDLDLQLKALESLIWKINRYRLGTTYYTGKGIFKHRKNYDNHKINFDLETNDRIYKITGYKLQDEKIAQADGNHKIKSTFVIEYIQEPVEINKDTENDNLKILKNGASGC